MAKFYRKSRKTFRKRKTYRKKRTFAKRAKSTIRYDGMIKVKLSATKEINNTDVNGSATFLVHWGNQIQAPTASQMTIQDTPEWTRYGNLFKYFCVQGVKMEYKPYGFNSGS